MDELDKRAICARLKKARVEAGLNETEMGDALVPPVRDRTIRNYETFRPPFRYLRQWAQITDVSYDWLLRGEGAPRAEQDLAADLQEVQRLLQRLAELVARGFDELGVPQDVLQPAEDGPDRTAGPA